MYGYIFKICRIIVKIINNIFICLYFYASIFVDMQKYIIFALSNF